MTGRVVTVREPLRTDIDAELAEVVAQAERDRTEMWHTYFYAIPRPCTTDRLYDMLDSQKVAIEKLIGALTEGPVPG